MRRRLCVLVLTLPLEVIRDIAALKTKPVYREAPVYPAGETDSMLKLMRLTSSEKKDLPSAYRLIFEDLRTRLPMDTSRDAICMATSELLATATPAHARYFLDFELEPYFESLNKSAIVSAIQEESMRSGQ